MMTVMMMAMMTILAIITASISAATAARVDGNPAEALKWIALAESGELALTDDTWEVLSRTVPTRSRLRRMMVTCAECPDPYKRRSLSSGDRYHEVHVPFQALTVSLEFKPNDDKHLENIFIGDVCVFNASIVATKWSFGVPVVKHRLLVQNRMQVWVKIFRGTRFTGAYFIDLMRDIEPACGWMFNIESPFQRITMYKGDRTKIRATDPCGLYVTKDDEFMRSWVTPRTPHYQMVLSGEIQTDTAEEQSHGVMVRWPLMYAKELRNILIIGGGDAQAAKEFLKFPHLLRNVEHFVNVELDGTLVDLWTNHPLTRHLSNNAYLDPRLEVVVGDGIGYLVNSNITWDIIIDDCEVEVSKQPQSFKRLYKLYERALVDKLAPGGVAQIMNPIMWEDALPMVERNDDDDIDDDDALDRLEQWYCGKMDARHRNIFMQRQARLLRESREWLRRAEYVMSQVAYAGAVGSEEYIFFSNSPFVKRRDIPPVPDLHNNIGGWCHRRLPEGRRRRRRQ